jgi:prepilin-type N-terminal cleavage/methylation domain-containing protein
MGIHTCPVQQILRVARRAGFTLIELLVVTAIIALLIGVLLPALSRSRTVSRKTRELSGARQLMVGVSAYANDSNDRVPVGYATSSMVSLNGPISVYNAEGERLTGLAAQRYPWRLAPYLGDDLRGFYHDPRTLADLRAGATKFAQWGVDYTYFVSLYPSLGINARFIGGDAQSTLDPNFIRSFGKVFVSRLGDAARPSELIAFASARSGSFAGLDDFATVDGGYRVDPPFFAEPRPRQWDTAYDARSISPGINSGFVALRYEGRAVIALLDGHADARGWTQLQDMRSWSDRAAHADWTIPAK